MKRMGRVFPLLLGGILVLMGVAFLVGAFVPGWSGFSLWPVVLVIPVVSMLSGVRNRQDLGQVIFWVTYLTYLMVFFLVLNVVGWEAMERMWPHFILAAGVSFLAEFVVKRKWYILVEMGVTTFLGVYFLIPGLPWEILGGGFLILLGGSILVKSFMPQEKNKKGE